MSDVKKPMAGEWWEYDGVDGTKFRLFVIGPLRNFSNRYYAEASSGSIEMYDIDPMTWNHLPECDSFEWKPEVFPQYWDAEPDGSAAYNRRDSATKTVCVDTHGTEHEWKYKWEERNWNHLQITKEQAEALLLPNPKSSETRTVTINRWLCWNEVGKERLIHAANRPVGFQNALNVGEEKFEVKP